MLFEVSEGLWVNSMLPQLISRDSLDSYLVICNIVSKEIVAFANDFNIEICYTKIVKN